MIAILDYDMGNLRSVQKGFEHVGAEAQIITDPDQIARADKVVLPGQGAFKDAIARFRSHGLGDALNEHVSAGKPMLGICLGLQLLFERSCEDGEHEGLSWYRGEVVRFDFAGRNDDPPLRIPQMGWNQITWQRECPLLAGVPQGAYVYFAHSYHVKPAQDDVTLCTTEYGYPYTSATWRDNVFATQFHPEKSQKVGLQVLRNFAKL